MQKSKANLAEQTPQPASSAHRAEPMARSMTGGSGDAEPEPRHA